MTDGEKKVAFLRYAARMAEAEIAQKYLSSDLILLTEFWIGDVKIEFRASTRLNHLQGWAKIKGSIARDTFPRDTSNMEYDKAILTMKKSLTAAIASQTLTDFRAITFLTALLDFDPEHETDTLPT